MLRFTACSRCLQMARTPIKAAGSFAPCAPFVPAKGGQSIEPPRATDAGNNKTAPLEAEANASVLPWAVAKAPSAVGQLNAFRTGAYPLHVAAEAGDLSAVKLLLADPSCTKDAQAPFGETALHRASRNGHTKCVSELLDAGADVTVAADNANTPLHVAVGKGNVDVVRLLIAHPGFEKIRDARNVTGNTALNWACFDGHVECVRELLDAGADITVTVADRPSQETALHTAVEWGKVDVARLLIAHPDFKKIRDARNCAGETALQRASLRDHTKCVSELLDAGADITVAAKDASTALHMAVGKGNVDVVRLLIAHPGFEKIRDARNFNGDTALQRASFLGHPECARDLLDAGADIIVANGEGKTALHHAAERGKVDVVRLLAAHPDFKKMCDARDSVGSTALHYATGRGFTQCVRVVLAGGADITAADNDDADDGNTALHYAARNGDVDIVLLFIAHANFPKIRDARNSKGETALHLASRYGHTRCVRVLLAAGADVTVASDVGDTVLHVAAKHATGIVRLLVKHAEFENIRDKRNNDDNTAMDVAKTQKIVALLSTKATKQSKQTPTQKATAIAVE